MTIVLFTRSVIRGKTRVGEVVAGQDLKIGCVPLAVAKDPPDVAGPRSYCSQLNVKRSPSASFPDAVSSNGVLTGMVQPPAGIETVGTEFPVFVMLAHVLPFPNCEKFTISLYE